MLHMFNGIPIQEQMLDAVGRNAHNTRAVRNVDQRELWQDMRDIATRMATKWSPKTPLGEGARYLLRHFDRLTYYLDDPRVAPSNNFSERMLRQEKLIQNSALFRQSLQGRFALDIMRTILQTAVVAGANPVAYLIWVMRMPRETVAAEPDQFTPQAFVRWWEDYGGNDPPAAAVQEARVTAQVTASA